MEQDYVIKLCDDLCEALNNNPMPISAKYFVVKDFFNSVQGVYDEYLMQQRQAREEKTESMKVDVPIDAETTEALKSALDTKKQ